MHLPVLCLDPTRPVRSPVSTRRQMAAGADVLPPWKQEGYVSEVSYRTKVVEVAGAAGVTQVRSERRPVHNVVCSDDMLVS